MSRFFSLFHCESYGSNRRYEDRFQWFLVSLSNENQFLRADPGKINELLRAARRSSSDLEAIRSIANLLSSSLEFGAYLEFLEDIRPLEIAIF